MSDRAKESEPYVLRQILGAVEVAAQGATLADRAAAAKIVHALVGVFFHNRVGETLATKIANVLGQRIDEPQVVRQLLRTLIIGCREHDKLAAAVERLAEQATERSLRESLWHFVCGMLETAAWRTRVRGECAGEALAYAMAQGASTLLRPERIVRAWLDLHGAVPEWMASAIEQRPDLLLSPHLPSRWVWPLHAAAPTTQGWHLLGGSLRHKCQPLDAVLFGPDLDVALETLDRALGEERDSARRIALAGWLAELGGPGP